eukprot:6632890-Pyramimonas_sp.AAC.1
MGPPRTAAQAAKFGIAQSSCRPRARLAMFWLLLCRALSAFALLGSVIKRGCGIAARARGGARAAAAGPGGAGP